MVAILIGTSSLIILLSIFNGFEDLVKSLYSTFYSDIKISAAQGKYFELNDVEIEQIRSVKGVKNLSLSITQKAILQNGQHQTVMTLKGVDENYRYINTFSDHLFKGDYNLGNAETPELILGGGVEDAVGLQYGPSIYPLVVYVPKRGRINVQNPYQSVNADTILHSGTFFIQQEFDNQYGITNLPFIKRLMNFAPNRYGAVEISLHDSHNSQSVKEKLENLLGKELNVATRYEQNQSLYKIMNSERWVIFAILSLVLAIAAFTMIGTITMLILEKQKDIAVLHILGATNSFIQKIFIGEGMILAIIGGGLGFIIALLFAFLQNTFHLIPLQGGSFLIDYFPIQLQWADFLQIGTAVFIITMAASWLPARKAAKEWVSLKTE